MISDTTFIVDLLRNDARAITKLKELMKKNELSFVTTLTIFELFSGLFRSNNPIKEKSRVIDVLKRQMIINLDPESAEKAGEIDGNLILKGKMIQPVDCMIAGIALVKKDKVLTRNVKDFSKIEGLEIESY